MQNTLKLKDWLEIWRFGANFHLNETTRFKQNDVVSCDFQKKRKQKRERETKRCHFGAALFLLLLPPDMQQGSRGFAFFSLSLPLLPTCSATHLMMRCPSSRAPQATPPLAPRSASWQRWQRAPHARGDGTGQGRPRSPCPYKYHPNTEKEGRRNDRKRGGRPRERETNKKKTGENRGGGRKEKERRKRSRAERQTWRRKNTRQKEKTAGGEDTDWCLYTTEKKRRRCH